MALRTTMTSVVGETGHRSGASRPLRAPLPVVQGRLRTPPAFSRVAVAAEYATRSKLASSGRRKPRLSRCIATTTHWIRTLPS